MNARGRIEGYLPRLYGYALSLVRDPHQDEDLVQDCAVKALSARNTPADEAAFRAWLFQILRNTFFDRLRRAKTVTAYAEDPKHHPLSVCRLNRSMQHIVTTNPRQN